MCIRNLNPFNIGSEIFSRIAYFLLRPLAPQKFIFISEAENINIVNDINSRSQILKDIDKQEKQTLGTNTSYGIAFIYISENTMQSNTLLFKGSEQSQ